MADFVLIFGAWGKSSILLQIWIGLSLIIIAIIFALSGVWQVTILATVYAISLLLVIHLVKRFEQESPPPPPPIQSGLQANSNVDAGDLASFPYVK